MALNPTPPSGPTLTLGPEANPPPTIPPPDPPNPPLPPQNLKANGLENPNRNMPSRAPGENQDQALVTSLDEARAPYLYATNGHFAFNGTILGTEEPQGTFNSAIKLVIDTLQGGLNAPTAPTPNLLSMEDWARLSCALLAAIGRGYSLMYDQDRAGVTASTDWANAPDPKPLGPKYPTLLHRLSATADSLADQVLTDVPEEEHSLAGWILEAKAGIHRKETEAIKALVKEDWRQWWTVQVNNKSASQAKEIADAACKRNVSYFCSAAAEFGLRLAPSAPAPPLPPPQTLPTGTPRGKKRTISGSAPSTEPTTPRKHKANPPKDAINAPSPSATPRGRPADPRALKSTRTDPSPTPQPKRAPAVPQAVLSLSPKVTLNLGPKVSALPPQTPGQLDIATITAAIQTAMGPAIQAAMAPYSARLHALERTSMPPPMARSIPHPNHGAPPSQYNPPTPQQPTHLTQPSHEGSGFTTVSRTKGKKNNNGKTNGNGPIPDQVRQTNPSPPSYAGVAAAATNAQQPQPQPPKTGGTSTPTITEVTVLRAGGLLDSHKENQIRARAADAIVREIRLKMAKITAKPIRLRAGRWSISPRSKGNFVLSFDGNVPFDTIKSYQHILLAPFEGCGELCPSMGWTRFLANGVPVWDDDDHHFGPDALLEEVRTLPHQQNVKVLNLT